MITLLSVMAALDEVDCVAAIADDSESRPGRGSWNLFARYAGESMAMMLQTIRSCWQSLPTLR